MGLTKVGKRRLMKVVKMLEKKVPRTRFNYYDLVSDCTELIKAKSLHKCSTAACALGWMPSFPEFKRDGWRYDSSGLPRTTRQPEPFAAAARYFQISWSDSEYLFSPDVGDSNATPKQVAKKIRRWIKDAEFDR